MYLNALQIVSKVSVESQLHFGICTLVKSTIKTQEKSGKQQEKEKKVMLPNLEATNRPDPLERAQTSLTPPGPNICGAKSLLLHAHPAWLFVGQAAPSPDEMIQFERTAPGVASTKRAFPILDHAPVSKRLDLDPLQEREGENA